jgi:Peptidase family M41/ATPase family associated with various cellular activities (AAA)
MLQFDLSAIIERKKTLEHVKTELKKEFIGIDDVIDDLLDYIQVWYLVPEILKRPVIVNLWGMTGVGKTDLVRKFVKLLQMQDRFAEIELSNIDTTSWKSSVSSVLEDYGFQDSKPCIVLFDEIQRFNTLDEKGQPMPQSKFTDFWELLSDGHLSKRTKEDMDYYLYNYLFKKKDTQRKKDRGETVDEATPMVGYWDASQLKKGLGLDSDISNLADMSEEQMIEVITAAKKKKKIYEPINHAKTLIIISGNLDEAFQMAGHTSEADIDADIFHAYTTKITVVDVKNALTRKFRPEQVARFGNIHLIYKSLKKVDFEQLIVREIARICTDTKATLGITITIDKSIQSLIYRNGVFPVQGVRPVFSSVIDILESNLSKFIYEALVTKAKTIKVSYDEVNKKIIALIGKEKVEIPYVGRIDKIRQGNEAASVANISVHESGHAVAYMALLGLAPLQLKSKLASSYAGGFTFPHDIHHTKRNILIMIKVFLAGGIAEELIFGTYEASIGRENDRERATMLTLEYVRKYGFDEEFQANYTIDNYPYRMDTAHTDVDAEKMITRLVSETKELLSEHRELLKGLSVELSLKGSLEADEMVAVAKRYGMSVLQKPEGFLVITDYDQKLNAVNQDKK